MVVIEDTMEQKADYYMRFLAYMYKLIEWAVGSLHSKGGNINLYLTSILFSSYTYVNIAGLDNYHQIMTTEILEIAITCSAVTIQIYTYYCEKSTFCDYHDLCKETLVYIISKEDTFEGLPATADSILRKSQESLRKINRWVSLVLALHCVTYIVGPLFSEGENCYLEPPGPAWLPLDCKKPLQFFVIYAHLGLGESTMGIIIISAMMLRSTFSSLISVQCQVLKMYIESLGKSEGNEILTEFQNQKMEERCRICVVIYQKLQKQVLLIEKICSVQMLVDILSAVTASSLLVYKTGALRKYQYIPACLVVALELYFVCRMGEIIHEKMVVIGQSCYLSNWYNLSPKNRKSLRLTMMTSHKTKYVRAVKMVDSSYSTFEKVFRAGYTFLIFLFESHLLKD